MKCLSFFAELFCIDVAFDFHILWQQVIQDVFSANCVAVVFVMSILLSALLPKDMEIKRDVNTK